MRKRFAIVIATFAAAFLGAGTARAAECGPGIFQMADGSWYHISSGTSAGTCVNLLNAIGAAPPAAEPAPPVDAAPPSGTLRSAVERGRAMIAERIAAAKAAQTKPIQVASTEAWVDIALAVWDQATDEVSIVPAGASFRKSGMQLDLHVPPGTLDIDVMRTNGVNSHFVADKGKKVVVAVQSPIFKEKRLTSKNRVYELEDVLYTPYSSTLHTPEMAAWGEATIDAMIGQAYSDLRSMSIMSRAFPDRLMADVIDPKLVKAIAVIEHLSEASLAGASAAQAEESFYVIMAGNQDAAYAYSRSPAGAKGLVQFIPSTYKAMAARKELQLDPDFETGMANPRNAIRAQIAYLDLELASMPASVKALVATDPARVDEYLAAAYNGGGPRVRNAIAKLGEDWSKEPSEHLKRYEALFAQAESLRQRILAEDDEAVWRPMQAKLNALRVEYRAAKAKADSGLRKETALYVQKLRNLLRLWSVPPILT